MLQNVPFHRSTTVMLLIFFWVIFAAPSGAQTRLEILKDETFKETGSGKIWQLNLSDRIRTADQVEDVLIQLNKGKYSDWRLPTKAELYELFAIFDLKENGAVRTRVEGKYWLADNNGKPYVGIWEIGDQCGPSRTFYKGKAGYVRALRP